MRRNRPPINANMTSPMAPIAAENRRDLKKETSSIGCDECLSQVMNAARTTTAAATAPRMSGEVQERSGASMIPHSSSPMPTMERAGADRVGTLGIGVLRVGHEPDGGEQSDHGDGHIDEEDRAPPEVSEQPAAGDGADCHAEPGRARPDSDGPGSLTSFGEGARQDRQGRGHYGCASDAHEGPCRDEPIG